MDFIFENAYQVLGISANASEREIIKQADEIKSYLKIGKAPEYKTDIILQKSISRNKESIDKAVQTLNNTKSKLFHKLSWFYILDRYDSISIDALRDKNIEKAINTWIAASKGEEKHYIKNLATLELHLAFHDTDNDSLHLKKYINYWIKLISSNDFKVYLGKIDKELSQSLKNKNVLHDYLNATTQPFLNEWLDSNEIEKIKKFFFFINKKVNETDFIKEIQQNFLKPLGDKLENDIENILIYDNKYSERFIGTTSFLEKITPYFKLLKCIGDDYIIKFYGDKILKIILDRTIEYVNRTEDWRNAIEILKSAKLFISKHSEYNLKHRFERNMKVITRNYEDYNNYRKMIYKKRKRRKIITYAVYIIIFAIIIIIASIDSSINNNSDYNYSQKTYNHNSSSKIINKRINDKDLSKSIENYATSENTNSKQAGEILYDYVNKSSTLKELGNEINKNEQIIKEMESELEKTETKLEEYNRKLKELENKIAEAEIDLELGLDINRSQYEENIKNFNKLVNLYNSTLENYKKKYDEYKVLFNLTKEKIDQYNALIAVIGKKQ